MTHPMLERLTKVIAVTQLCEDAGLTQAHAEAEAATAWPHWENTARAAVQALLEPDEGMKEAGAAELFGSSDDDWTVDARCVFRAMLLPLIEGEG